MSKANDLKFKEQQIEALLKGKDTGKMDDAKFSSQSSEMKEGLNDSLIQSLRQ